MKDLGISDGHGGRLKLFPAAESARRDHQTLNSQGLAEMLVCVATFTLLVDELSD